MIIIEMEVKQQWESFLILQLRIYKMSLLDQLSSLCGNNSSNPYPSSFFAPQQNDSLSDNKRIRPMSVTPAKTIKLFNDEDMKSVYGSSKKPQIFSQAKPKSQSDRKNQTLKQLTKISYILKNKIRKQSYEFFVKLQKYSAFLLKQRQNLERAKIQNLEKGFQKLVQTVNIINLKYFQNDQKKQQHQKFKYFLNQLKRMTLFKCKLQKVVKIMYMYQCRVFGDKLRKNNNNCMKLQIFNNSTGNCFLRNMRLGFIALSEIAEKSCCLENQQQKGSKYSYIQLQNEQYQKQSEKSQKKKPQIYRQTSQTHIIEDDEPKLQAQSQHSISQTTKNKIKCIRQIFPMLPNKCKVKFQLHDLILKTPNIQKIAKMNQNPFELSFNSSLQSKSQINNNSNDNQHRCQNIPLKLHAIKSHEQQTNVSDCIDNGHLLMNQIRSNLNLQSQISSITNSINCTHQNSTVSLASSALRSECNTVAANSNNLLPLEIYLNQYQFQQENYPKSNSKNKVNHQKDHRDGCLDQQFEYDNNSQLATMRNTLQHSKNDYSMVSNSSAKRRNSMLKKPRSSLIVTKRRDSSETIVRQQQTTSKNKINKNNNDATTGFHNNNNKNSMDMNCSKPTAGMSISSILNNSQQGTVDNQSNEKKLHDRNSLRKMLDQLNDKYSQNNISTLQNKNKQGKHKPLKQQLSSDKKTTPVKATSANRHLQDNGGSANSKKKALEKASEKNKYLKIHLNNNNNNNDNNNNNNNNSSYNNRNSGNKFNDDSGGDIISDIKANKSNSKNRNSCFDKIQFIDNTHNNKNNNKSVSLNNDSNQQKATLKESKLFNAIQQISRYEYQDCFDVISQKKKNSYSYSHKSLNGEPTDTNLKSKGKQQQQGQSISIALHNNTNKNKSNSVYEQPKGKNLKIMTTSAQGYYSQQPKNLNQCTETLTPNHTSQLQIQPGDQNEWARKMNIEFQQDSSKSSSDSNKGSGKPQIGLPDSDESYLIRNANNAMSSDADSAAEEYIKCLPSDQSKCQINNEEDQIFNKSSSISINKSHNRRHHKNSINNNVLESHPSEMFLLYNPLSSNKTSSRQLNDQSNSSLRNSLQKNRKSFQKSKQSWDKMFDKQKNRFLKKSNPKRSDKKASLDNSVISQIKAKIEKCILGTKDLNSSGVKQTTRARDSIITLKPYLAK